MSLKSWLVSGVALGAIVLSASLGAGGALAAPTQYRTPNIVTDAGATSVTFGGRTFVNQGLQGVARLDATTTKDFNGDTFGAFSGLDVLPGTWRRTATGYTGTMFSLPDRGPNGVGSVTFSDYAARVSSLGMNFTPYTGAATLPASEASQHQLQLTLNGGFFFRDFNGNVTTGLDPGAPGATSFVTQAGRQLPGSTVGVAANKIALDAEGLRFLNDGTFYVSDEYGANVYYFDRQGRMQGVITPPPALVPRNAAGDLSFTSLTDATVGRRLNQGLEGMAVTPDQKKLVTLLQSAAMQDSTTAQQTRSNTRLMVYDISAGKTPTTPVAHYVLELPIFNSAGNGAPNRAAAQSELLALNDTQFLVLSRDGNGLGQANLNPVYKSVLLVDTTGATNIAGTAFETGYTPIAAAGTLNSTIVPVQQVEVVNMLNATQLGKFGINLNNTAPTRLTITEKWEGMALLPVLEENAPQDFFLFVGNDNDFLASNCSVGGQNCAQAVNSDAVVLVYRLTLPTYVDPIYLASMMEAGPAALAVAGQAGIGVAATNSGNIQAQLNAHRRAGISQAGFSSWVSGTWARTKWDDAGVTRDGFRGTAGIDYALSPEFVLGAAAGYGQQDLDTDGGFKAEADGYSVSVYAKVQQDGFYGLVGYSRGKANYDVITRPAAYGLTARGETDGMIQSIFAEGGYRFDAGDFKLGPVVTYQNDKARLNAYTETGAAGGNIAVATNTATSSVFGFGGEIYGDLGGVMPYARVTYNRDFQDEPRTATLSLASAQAAMGTQSVSVPTVNQDFTDIGVGIQGTAGQMVWNLGYNAQIGKDDRTGHLVRFGVGYTFN